MDDQSPDRCSNVRISSGSPSQRLTAWQEVFHLSGQALIADEILPGFEGQFDSARFGELMAVRISSHPFRFVRDASIVAAVKRDMVMINLFETGGATGTIAGRTVRLEAGDMVLSRYASTITLDNLNGTWLGLLVPRRLIEPQLPWKRSLDGKVFAASSATALILGNHLRTLLSLPQEMTERDVAQIERATLALVVAQLGGRPGASDSAAPTDDDTMNRVRRFIVRYVRDPALDTAMICRELSLSRSQLYRVGEGSEGIAAMIRETRLQNIHRDIVSNRLGEQSLTAIASRWGLSDPRTFRRAFARRFGCSPSELRERTKASSHHGTLPFNGELNEFRNWFDGY